MDRGVGAAIQAGEGHLDASQRVWPGVWSWSRSWRRRWRWSHTRRGVALGQQVPQQICGARRGGTPRPIGQPDANGWTSKEESLANGGRASDGTASACKEQGTAYVYVGDQWYDLNLGLFSMKDRHGGRLLDRAGQGPRPTESEMHRLGFVRPGRAGHRGRARRLHPDAPGRRQRASSIRAGSSRCASRSGRASAPWSPANIPDPELPWA